MRRFRYLAVGTSAALVFGFAALPAKADETAQTYIVTVPDASAKEGNQLVLEVGGEVGEQFKAIDTRTAELTPDQAETLDSIPGVIISENVILSKTELASESAKSWGLDRIDQANLPLTNTFQYSNVDQGNGVKAYVIDTGVLRSHQEFKGRIESGFGAVSDGQGSNDCDGHGTHVAGTIAGKTVGIARAATIVPVRVLDCDGYGYLSDVLDGIDWVITNHQSNAPAVANLSLGYGSAVDVMDEAIQALVDDGITTVVAAGNDGVDACGSSPARAVNAITVGATNTADERTVWSNYGTCVDIFAPGGRNYIGGQEIYSAGIASTRSYAEMSGTSMAAPHVAGVAARYLSVHPRQTPAQVTTALLTAASTGKVTYAGTGSPNKLLYLNPAGFGPLGLPLSAPTSVGASVSGFNELSVSWAAPSSSGDEEITGYKIRVYNSTSRTYVSPDADTVAGDVFEYSIGSLVAGSKYVFEIQAITSSFPSGGPVAKSSTLISYGRPGAVTGISVKNSTGKATISWKAPRDTGKAKITGYEIQLTSTNNSDWTGEWIPTTRTSYVLTGTPVGRQENRAVMIRALTIAGSGPDVPISITVGK